VCVHKNLKIMWCDRGLFSVDSWDIFNFFPDVKWYRYLIIQNNTERDLLKMTDYWKPYLKFDVIILF